MEEYFLFIDESGTASLKEIDEEFPVLALVGILISSSSYNQLIDQVEKLKADFFHDKTIVLHERDIRKRQNGFESLVSAQKRKTFHNRLHKIIDESDLKIIACIIDKKEYIKTYGKMTSEPYSLALTFMLERVIFEAKRADAIVQTYIEGRGKKEDAIISSKYNELCHKGTNYIKPEEFFQYLTPKLHVTHKSDNEIGIELADLCAYPIACNTLHNDRQTEAYKHISAKICRSSRGQALGYGIKLFPKK